MKEQNQRQIQNQTELDERRLRQKKLVRKRKIVLSVMLLTSFYWDVSVEDIFLRSNLEKQKKCWHQRRITPVKGKKKIKLQITR